jgi:hypothetical protein
MCLACAPNLDGRVEQSFVKSNIDPLKTQGGFLPATVGLNWIAGRLGTGHESQVSQAVLRVRQRPARRLKRLHRLLKVIGRRERLNGE